MSDYETSSRYIVSWIMTLFVLFGFGHPVNGKADSMTPMDENELQSISGGDAIQLTLRLRNNVGEDNLPDTACGGTPDPCRLGLEFVAREGNWLVLKDFYGSLAIEDVRLEGAFLSHTGSSYRDLSRFQDADGNCLLSPCNPDGLPAIQLDYPFAKGPGEYQDLHTFLNIGRMAVEGDDAGTPGFMLDNNPGSALAFRMSDSASPNRDMQMRFDGRAFLYGF
jgi:bacteriocin-like protein